MRKRITRYFAGGLGLAFTAVFPSVAQACVPNDLEMLRSLCVENTEASEVSPRGQRLFESGLRTNNQDEALRGLRLCVNDDKTFNNALSECEKEDAFAFFQEPYAIAANDHLASSSRQIEIDCIAELNQVFDDLNNGAQSAETRQIIFDARTTVPLLCTVSWDLEKIKQIATIFQVGGLFQFQWKGELSPVVRRLGELELQPWALIYMTLEAGTYLLELDDIEVRQEFKDARGSLREVYPDFPDEENLDLMREAMLSLGYITHSAQLPFELQVRRYDPDVAIITDIGKHLTFEDLLKEALLLTNQDVQQKEVENLKRLAQGLDIELDFATSKGVTVNTVALLISAILEEGMQIRRALESQGIVDNDEFTGGDLLTIRMIATDALIECDGITYNGSAYYCPSTNSTQVRRTLPPNGERFVFNSGSQSLLDAYQFLISSELIHEIHHFLFNRTATESVRLLAEGEAYARGENFSQRILYGLAFATSQEGLASVLRAAPDGLAATALQLEFACKVQENPLTGQEIEKALGVPAEFFDRQPKEWHDRMRPSFWAIFHFGLYGEGVEQEWLSELVRIGIKLSQGLDSGTNETEFLDRVAERTMSDLTRFIKKQGKPVCS